MIVNASNSPLSHSAATVALVAVQSFCLGKPAGRDHSLDCGFKLGRVELSLGFAFPAKWNASGLFAKDGLHEFGVLQDAFIHIHLKAAKHDGNETNDCQNKSKD